MEETKMIGFSKGWKLAFLVQAAFLAGGIVWLATGTKSPATDRFINSVRILDHEQVVQYTAEAQAYSEICSFPLNARTDGMAYKAAGLRKSHLAKRPHLRAAFERA